jgi:hypothetical protein
MNVLFPFLLIIDLLVVAPLAGWLARRKGRPFEDGAMVGAAFGLLGLALLGVAPATSLTKPLSHFAVVLLALIGGLMVWLLALVPGMS